LASHVVSGQESPQSKVPPSRLTRVIPVVGLALATLAAMTLESGAKNQGVEIAVAAGLCLIIGHRLGLSQIAPDLELADRADAQPANLPSISIPLAGLAILFAAVTGYLTVKSVNGLLPVLPWLAGVICAVAAFRNRRPVGFVKRDLVASLILLVLSLASRTIDLGSIPFGTHDDEAHWGQIAFSIWQNKAPVFAYLWDGYPGSSFVPYSLTLGLLGENLTSARLASALVGALGIPLLYLLGTIAFDRMTGVFAAALLLTNASNFHFTRMALPNIEAIPIALGGGIALLAVIRQPEGRRSWAFLGASAGMCLIGYLTSVFWPMVAAVALLPFCVSLLRAGRQRELLSGIGIALFVCVLTASPIVIYSVKHPGFGSRGSTITIWNMEGRAHVAASYGVALDDMTGILRGQIQRSLASIYSFHDSSVQYAGRETLDSVAGVAFMLGWFSLLLRRNFRGTWLTAVYFVLSMTLGSILIRDPPFQPRMVAITPSLCLIAGLGTAMLWRQVVSGFRDATRWAFALGGVTVLISAALSFVYYFGDYRIHYPNAQPTALARYFSTVQDSGMVFLVGLDEPTDAPTFTFAAPRTPLGNWKLGEPPPAQPQLIRSFVFPVDGPNALRARNMVESTFPKGHEYVLTSVTGVSVAKVWDLHT
jgi:4-amino-4-deoxy-L-arabinose transferase-like glycosyltransferase